MKKKFLVLIMTLMLLISIFGLVGCDALDLFDDEEGAGIPQIDNSIDLQEFTPATDDDTVYIENETYYTSASIDLVTEVNGNYTINRPFTLDKNNTNKRIYHNIYFYEDDFFQVIYYKKVGDLGQLYVIMSDTNDQEYAEIEYTTKGTPLQVNIKKQGIYNLIFDIETFAIDMEKIGDIDLPVYETIKSCNLNIHVSLEDHTYTPMTLNKETNEYYIEKEIPLYASIGFYSDSHTSHYNITVDPSLMDTLIYYDNLSPNQVQVHVGGKYKIYFNAKTYLLRLELVNPDTSSYFCQVGWQEDKVLTPISNSTPYLFEYEFVAQGKVNDPYVDIPSFYPSLGMKYKLSIIDQDGFVFNDEYLTESGTYKLTVNLKEFTLTVNKLS